ncbi:hypothetical protein ASD81_13050 [Nocardioides sp. Root614]|nr:hypothetical protein ASD81_13050 [Nocardioides sp. Root614]KRA89138.1 hypothetical protein ASD84_13315 [Nocardioides sp. Root682]
MPIPTRDEIKLVLEGLLRGTTSPAEASTWVVRRLYEAPDPASWNEATEDALSALAIADAQTGPSTYLYGTEDFATWLDEFREAWPGA